MVKIAHEDGNYWLGASDMGHEGEWMWLNSLKPVEDFVWHSGFGLFSCVKVFNSTVLILQDNQMVEYTIIACIGRKTGMLQGIYHVIILVV